MSAILIFFLGLWGFLVWLALTVARSRLSGEEAPPSWRDVLLARGTAFVAASLALLVASRFLALVSRPSPGLVLVAWAISVSPLVIPSWRRAGARPLLSSQGAIAASVVATALSVLGLALYLLIRLLLTNPELL